MITATAGELQGQGRPPCRRRGPGLLGRGGGWQQQGHHPGDPGQGALHLGRLRQTLQVRDMEKHDYFLCEGRSSSICGRPQFVFCTQNTKTINVRHPKVERQNPQLQTTILEGVEMRLPPSKGRQF